MNDIGQNFLDALASLDFKLSVSQSLSDSPFFTASASTGLSDYFLRLKENFRLLSTGYNKCDQRHLHIHPGTFL